jgi:hypothetical protein
VSEQQNPQTLPGGPYSEMKLVVANAMNLWGVSHAAVLDGTASHMFLLFANAVIEDINSHPYWENNPQLDYIQSLTEACPIPDLIMVYGLLAHYAAQQRNAEGIQLYKPQYDRMLNQMLWNRLNGNTPIEVRPVDRSEGRSVVNGRKTS